MSGKSIGVWISDKKSQKLNWKELIKACNSHGYNLVKVCLFIIYKFIIFIHIMFSIIVPFNFILCNIFFQEIHTHNFIFSFQLDLERAFEDQGKIDVFLHKLTDLIAAADQGDPKVKSIVFFFNFLLSTNILCLDTKKKEKK